MVDLKDVHEWVAENAQFFQPPVCNKCMFSDQLKMFFVGGPNQRRDYHLEEGEEVFYQLEGDMCLKVVEKGMKKDIVIKAGELFLLPARVEHSPQRFEETIGAVVERTRNSNELDCVRYFLGDTLNRQYERWFHLNDVVVDLPPVIKGFLASESSKRNEVTDESFPDKAPYEPREVTLDEPVNLELLIAEHDFNEKNTLVVFGAPKYRSTVTVHGMGEHALESGEREEILLWLVKEGFANGNVEDDTLELSNGQMARIQPKKKIRFEVFAGWILSIRMP